VRKLSMEEVQHLAVLCARQIADEVAPHPLLVAIPRGGIPAAALIAAASSPSPVIVSSTEPVRLRAPRVLVDDIRVTGRTVELAREKWDPDMVVTLVAKGTGARDDAYAALEVPEGEWVQFPWEVADQDAGTPEDAVRRLIEWLGDDPNREDLLDTPARVLRFLSEFQAQAGAAVNVRCFRADGIDDLMVVSDIPLYSLCEHHLMPYLGTCHVGYLPSGQVLGLSKVARLVVQQASRLTIQERLTRQIAAAVSEACGSPSVAVVVKAVHTCMVMRGVKAVGSETVTSAMLGYFREQASLRAEFLRLVGA